MKSYHGSLARFVAVLALITLACAGGSAVARHRGRASDATPGDFAYYLLSLSWSPAYCLSSPDAAECNGPRRFGFVVHGLWPQYERGWPEHCDAPRSVSDDVVRSIADLMPARALVYHEWSAHGTCSGLEPALYFEMVRRAHDGLAVPQEFDAGTLTVEQSPSAIAAAFLRANPRLPAQALVVTCSGQDAPRLREVRICLDRELAPRACSADAIRGACRAPQILVPPIR